MVAKKNKYKADPVQPFAQREVKGKDLPVTRKWNPEVPRSLQRLQKFMDVSAGGKSKDGSGKHSAKTFSPVGSKFDKIKGIQENESVHHFKERLDRSMIAAEQSSISAAHHINSKRKRYLQKKTDKKIEKRSLKQLRLRHADNYVDKEIALLESASQAAFGEQAQAPPALILPKPIKSLPVNPNSSTKKRAPPTSEEAASDALTKQRILDRMRIRAMENYQKAKANRKLERAERAE